MPADKKDFLLLELKKQGIEASLADQYLTVLYRNQFNMNSTNHVCKEIFMTIPSTIYTSQDFYLIDAINENIENFKAAGFIDYWHFRLLDKRKLQAKETRNPKVIEMKHLSGCFHIWIFGSFVGTFVFIVEAFGSFGRKNMSRVWKLLQIIRAN